MATSVGIFRSRADAERALRRLQSLGVPSEDVNVLAPGATAGELDAVPTDEGEAPGTGKALGAVVGGAVGAAAGMPIGAAVTTMVPGIGPVIVAGAIGAALLGAGGAAIGGTLEDSVSEGVPRDELFVYEDALRQGRTVVVAVTEEAGRAEAVRQAFAEAGAESVDAAREQWWIGLRDAEQRRYTAQGGDFAREEEAFRRGFEAALHRHLRGRPFEEALGDLRRRYPDVVGGPAFRHGYERGQAYSRELTTPLEKTA